MQLVDDPNKIPQLAEAMQATHKSIVLIEEYVDGADMAMAYVEGIGPMGPALITLPDEDFYNYDLKSRRDEEVEIVPYDAPPSLRRKINRVTEALVHRLDLKGYAKIDYRVHGNTINLVEVNSQVSFHPEGEFATCCKASGYELKDVIQAIVETGLHAQRLPSAGVQL
jgi:D-alanine-D-alanine ligase-like ATP-grasp enzyme